MAELSDRELDALVAEKIMGEAKCKCEHQKRISTYAFYDSQTGNCKTCGLQVPKAFSTDRNAAYQVLERIAEKGLKDKHLDCLWLIVNPGIDPDNRTWGQVSKLMTATPRQICEAAIAACGVPV